MDAVFEIKPDAGFYVVEIKHRRVFNSFDDAKKCIAYLSSYASDAIIDVKCFYRSVNQCEKEEE